jgi:hypothetical protein
MQTRFPKSLLPQHYTESDRVGSTGANLSVIRCGVTFNNGEIVQLRYILSLNLCRVDV